MKCSASSQKMTVSYRRLHVHCFQFVLQALLSTLEEDTPILDTTSVLHSGTLQIAWRQGRADPAHQEIRTAHYLKNKKQEKNQRKDESAAVSQKGSQTHSSTRYSSCTQQELAEFLSRSLQGGERLLCSTATLRLRGKIRFS